jgi:leucyl aminopeptidase
MVAGGKTAGSRSSGRRGSSALPGMAARAGAGTLPVTLLEPGREALARWLKGKPAKVGRWLEQNGFLAKAGSFCLLPGADGGIERVLAAADPEEGPWQLAGLAAGLPAGRYEIQGRLSRRQAEDIALGWILAGYRFDRYREIEGQGALLVWPKEADRAAVTRLAEAVTLVRDLVNTPAEDMGPAELAAAARALGKRHKAKVSVIVGDDLLKKNYPLVHAVGRASSRAPRLIDLRWGTKGPRVTLVGKGVCFDTGGLDLKPSGGMKMMKKDMGGSAHVLGLAHAIMAARLPLRLRVLVPAVENSVSGSAFRPLDVIRSRQGLTVEIGNTDAEGRLVLADALTEGSREKPDLMIDFATLTGAARVALGTELPALFCNDEGLAARFVSAGEAAHDPVWRLPLHKPYRALLDSRVADMNNISDGGFAGAITAALFLQEFVGEGIPWAHLDIMAWNNRARPGRAVGAEAMGLRAALGVVEQLLAVKS